MAKSTLAQPKTENVSRPPVVVIMGHIDHGKSTLLDYIRKSNVVDGEVGGITQKMSAYEVLHKDKKITFLDTPGHESFGAIRARGASAADIAILIVSAEDGVKPQTVDAYKAIKKANLPYIVGISKIDKDNANIERAKISLSEHEIYVEGYGGDISFVPFSGKTGAGIDELLDMILLTAEVENFTTDTHAPAEAIVIESHRDKNRGISATLIIKNGTLSMGSFITAGPALAPVRIMENYLNKPIKSATAGSPVRIIGWSELPQVGGYCFTYESKKDAETFIEQNKEEVKVINSTGNAPTLDANGQETATVSILIKADTSGSLEALKYEINKLKVERVNLRIIGSGLGDIQENDIRMASGKVGTLIIGFSVKADSAVKTVAERLGIEIHLFDIIYKMTEWLEALAKEKTPRMEVEEQKGQMKVLKIFSVNKDKQVLGCRCESGVINVDDQVKLMRRGSEIARGRIRELQQQKNKVGEVTSGECGLMVDCKMEVAPGDYLEAVHKVIK
ncbi:MAG: translation initiation factor IF-2 [bacterium]